MSTAPSGAEVRTRRDLLTGRVAAAIEAEGTTSSVSRASWDELALEVFAFQRWAIPAYGRWCEARPRGAAEVETPICLDESLVSAAGTADAIELGACEIANIKPGRVLFELAGVPEPVAREAMRLAMHKLPMKCRFVRREGGDI